MIDRKKISVVMMGATGAVGGETLKTFLENNFIRKITLLGRRDIKGISSKHVEQYRANIFDSSSYSEFINDHDVAICTLGVGQPSKISKEEFVKIDKDAVIEFGKVCKAAGVKHFELLSSVGINHKSYNFFLRTKGELVQELVKMNFERLSIFQPSMILTPTNRYGFSQALTLALWPVIDKIFLGPLQKYKGIKVERLGKAIAFNTIENKSGIEYKTWKEIQLLSEQNA